MSSNKARAILKYQDDFVYHISKKLLYRKNKGTYILKENWDSLIILDACRYDFFEQIYKSGEVHRGELQWRYSRGYDTMSFLKENFINAGEELKNFALNKIVYITANPFVDKYLRGRVYKIISVWRTHWDFTENTVPPNYVYESALKTYYKYGKDKKYIIHFIQPHYPYIGHKITDRSLERAIKEITNGIGSYNNKKYYKFLHVYVSDIYAMMPLEEQIEGYKQNLRLAMKYVNKLIDFFTGTTVVTADHGESFGEFVHPLVPIKFFGHGKHVRAEHIIKIPWLVVSEKEKDKSVRTKIHKEIISKKIKKLI